ncbi:MAG TPA: VWA domain-containing protein [Terriglobia bacterium]|nr:VWA domain-containing protein [Terriglobia bacterium]
MARQRLLFYVLLLGTFSGSAVWGPAQENGTDVTVFKVTVNMVQLDVAVTDKKGNYVTRLTPWDFAIYEDGIPQKIATFGEENEAPRKLEDYKPGENNLTLATSSSAKARGRRDKGSSPDLFRQASPEQVSSLVAGASVFILFDTSNYMYRGFVFAQDAIAEFVRSLQEPAQVAFYSYSRNFSRASLVTPERSQVLRAIRTTVAGDDAALYNSLLLTLKDAAQLSGRKVVVVFSNGPDNASAVGPEDVREMAQTEGIPIYMISTQEARLDPVSTAVFERVSATTGGKVYFAKNWKEQQDAFASVRDDLAHLYSLSYYPQPNPNRGWRSITVKLVGQTLKGYHVRTRSGYRPKAVRLTEQIKPAT